MVAIRRKSSYQVADEATLKRQHDVDEKVAANLARLREDSHPTGDGPEPVALPIYDEKSFADHVLEMEKKLRCQCQFGHLVQEFFGNQSYSNFPEARLQGRGNLLYFIFVLCFLILNLALGAFSLVSVAISFYHDLEYTRSVDSNEIIRGNDHHLNSFFGPKFSDMFKRQSKAQAVFASTSGFCHITYLIVVAGFIFINHYTYRIHFIILFHIMMLVIRLVWGYLGHYSLSKETSEAIELGQKIRKTYAGASSVVGPVKIGEIYAHVSAYTGKLMEPRTADRIPLSVFEYCGHIQDKIPPTVLELINELSLCPDNFSKRCAVYFNWGCVGVDVIIFLVCIFWRVYATDPSRAEELSARKGSGNTIRKESWDPKKNHRVIGRITDTPPSSSSSSSSDDQKDLAGSRKLTAPDLKSMSHIDTLVHTRSGYAPHDLKSDSVMAIYGEPLRNAEEQAKFKSREERRNVVIGKRHFPANIAARMRPHERKDSDVW